MTGTFKLGHKQNAACLCIAIHFGDLLVGEMLFGGQLRERLGGHAVTDVIGDMHMHSTRSDGKEHPFIVAANYRKAGYDFMAITDHRKFYPSLETQRFYESLNLDVKFYTGEEVHLPGNDIHIVNFGGDYSVNGLLDCSLQYINKGADPNWRSTTGVCPDVMTEEEYRAEVNALAQTLEIPDNVEKFPYASCVWICNHIKKANGLGIFAHPYWISNVYQVPEDFTDHMFKTHHFDAFGFSAA